MALSDLTPFAGRKPKNEFSTVMLIGWWRIAGPQITQWACRLLTAYRARTVRSKECMQCSHRLRTLADSGGDPFYGIRTDIAHGENAAAAGFQGVVALRNLGAGQYKTFRI